MKFNGKNIKEMTSDEIIEMLKINGSLIRCIKEPSLGMMELAIKQNPFSIKYIQNPPIRMQVLAVTSNPHSIRSIINPSYAIQLIATTNCQVDELEDLMKEIENLDDSLFRFIKRRIKNKIQDG